MQLTWTRYLPTFIRRRIEGKDYLQDIIGNTGWMMGDRIIRKAVGLLVIILIARHFGPQLFGDFSYAVALVMIVSPIAMLALDAVAIRRLVLDPDCRNEVLGTSFIMMIGGGVLAFSLAMAAIFIVRPDERLVQWLVGILAAGTIVQAFIAIEFWFESQMQWKFTVYAKTSAFLLLSFVKVCLILLKAPLVAFAWAGLAETVVGSVGLLIVYQWRGYSIKAWRFSWATAGTMLRDSWPLTFTTLLAMIYLRIDQVMLGIMSGKEQVGFYAAAVRITEVNFIQVVISGSVLPAIISARKVSEELFYARMQKLYNLMAFISYLIAIPIMLFSSRIVSILFGSSYQTTGPLLAVLIWAGLFSSLDAARRISMVAQNWLRIDLMATFLACALNILLNFYLIPTHGAMGAVIASIISYWFAVHGTCLIFKPLHKTGWMLTKAMIYPKIW